jgi:hypothetical protein
VTLGVLFVGLASDASAAPEAPAAPPTKTIVSKNWAGYAGAGRDPYREVSASWNVPLVSCTDADILNPSQSVTWVGLGGSGASAAGLEQIGTRSWCQLGRPSYNSWIQIFPGPHEIIGEDTKPDDQMRATVEHLGGGDFRLTLSNHGYNGSGLKWTKEFTRHQEHMDGAVLIAECIVEAPANELYITQPLADFDYVKWHYCKAYGSSAPPGEVGIGENPKTTRIHMSDYHEVSGPKKAYTSKIFDRDIGSFRVDWKSRSGTGPGGAS